MERAALELRFPSVVKDASLERLRHYRHKRLLIEEARSGSIEFVAVIAGVSLYVVEQSLGVAFSDAVRESRAGRELREFFRRQIDEKADFVAESIRRTFGKRRRQVVVRAEPPGKDAPRVIHVETRTEPYRLTERPVGSLAEELRNTKVDQKPGKP